MLPLAGAALAMLFFVAVTSKADANPSAFQRKQTNAATSTQTYIPAGGLGTTTLAFDLGPNGSFSADSAALLIQLAATSSQPILNVEIQYAQGDGSIDCSVNQNACDWYVPGIGSDYAGLASSTPTLGMVQTPQFIYASSTISHAALTALNTATSTRMMYVKTPTRYVRAVFWLAIGSAPGGLWAEFVAKKQVQ